MSSYISFSIVFWLIQWHGIILLMLTLHIQNVLSLRSFKLVILITKLSIVMLEVVSSVASYLDHRNCSIYNH